MSIRTVIVVYEAVDKQISELNNHLKSIEREDEDVKLLITIPGVGINTALSFKIVIRNPERFSDSTDVGAYLAMTPREYSSGKYQKKRKNHKVMS